MNTATLVLNSEPHRELRHLVARCKRSVSRSKLSKGVLSFLDDLSRSEPRTQSVMKHYPEAASECAAAGAPMCDVFAPMWHIEADITARYFATCLPSLETAQHEEQRANAAVDEAQMRVERNPESVSARAELGEMIDWQIAASKTLRAVIAK